MRGLPHNDPPPQTYTINYNANDGINASGNAPPSQIKTQGVPLTLRSQIPTRAGYTFKGWATTSTAATAQYQPGGSYASDVAVTLWAVWESNIPQPTQYTLTLNANGGSVTPPTVTQAQGTTYNLPTPTRSNHTFTGWTLTGGGNLSGSSYTFGTSNGTVTAQWTANSQPPVTPTQWWESLPSFVQWILRWMLFGFIWMN